MNPVPHLGFIVAAYAVTAVTVAIMIVALVLDRRTQKRLLAKLGAQGRE